MGWKWNDMLGGAIDGALNYGPYGAIAGAILGGWSKDFDKGITGNSRSGLVENAIGLKSGGIGSRVMGNFSSDDRDKMYVDENGDFSWGSLLGNIGSLAGSYYGNKYGGNVGGSAGGNYGGNILGNLGNIIDRSGNDLPSNAGIQFGNSPSYSGDTVYFRPGQIYGNDFYRKYMPSRNSRTVLLGGNGSF